ncbi:MAG: hypothetical protein ACFFG0_29965, partial [Candidatus Thorarchaeota archaeon]
GDMVDHNAVVSMIIANHKFPSTYSPIDPNITFNVIRYPRGAQVLGVFVALSSSIQPIHSNQILAGFISTLIPILIFSVLFLRTKSYSLSATGFFFIILIPPSKIIDLAVNDFTLGNFINGTLAQHLVVLEFIGFFSIMIFFESIDLKMKFWLKMLIFSGLGSAIFITSYSMVFFIAIFIILELLQFLIKKITQEFNNNKLIIAYFLILLIFIGLICLLFIYLFLFSIFNSTFNVDFKRHVIESNFFFSNIFGIIIIFSTILLILNIIKKQKWNSSQLFFTISLFLIYLLYFFPDLSSFFFIRPDRSLFPIAGISIIMTFSYKPLHNFQNKKLQLIKKYQGKIDSVIFILILISTLLTLSPYISYSEKIQARGLTEDEYKVIKWIEENVESDDLILNDPSFSGLFLTSFSYRNVVFFRQLSIYESDDGDINNTMYAKRIHESIKIFRYPYDFNDTKAILVKYNISYIFVSSYNIYYNYFIKQYENRSNYTSDILISAYISNPYLSLEFQKGNSAVFQSII